MTPLSAFLLGNVTGALALAAVAVGFFGVLAWRSRPMDEEV